MRVALPWESPDLEEADADRQESSKVQDAVLDLKMLNFYIAFSVFVNSYFLRHFSSFVVAIPVWSEPEEN